MTINNENAASKAPLLAFVQRWLPPRWCLSACIISFQQAYLNAAFYAGSVIWWGGELWVSVRYRFAFLYQRKGKPLEQIAKQQEKL